MGDKFKEKHPKLAEFIQNKAPNILNAVGGVLPEQGYLGILKNLITSSPNLTPELKAEAARLLLDAQELELQDIANARAREIAIATSEHAPLINKIIQPILAIFIVAATLIIWALILFRNYEPKINEAMIIGSLTTMAGMVLSYYFGSSTGSASKQKQLDTMMSK